MAFAGFAQEKISPNYTDPRFMVQQAQRSEAPRLFADGIRGTLDDNDMAVYVPTLQISTEARSAQWAGVEQTGISIQPELISAPTYDVYIRAPWTYQEERQAAGWGLAIPNLMEKGAAQGIGRTLANMMLFGVNSKSGEGLLNAPNAMKMSLPPDMNGTTSLSSYDPGSFRLIIQMLCTTLATSLNILGVAGLEIEILTTQRVRSYMLGQVVQLTSQQRPGGGTQSPESAIIGNLGASGIRVRISCDDKLAGSMSNGMDAMIITVPKLPGYAGTDPVGTNIFGGEAQPNNPDINVFYTSGSVKSETVKSTTMETDYRMWNRATCGWNARSSGVMILALDAGNLTAGSNGVPIMPLPAKMQPLPLAA